MLRGIASILVLLLHVSINISESFNQPFLSGIFKFGGSGVDIFFVLSGFIITYSNRDALAKPTALSHFLKRRFIRIFPIYWIIITVFLLLQLFLSSFYKTPFSLTTDNVLKTWLLLPNHIMINGVSWSLTNELFFYLLFSLAIIIPAKKIAAYLGIAYLAVLVLLAIAGYSSTNPWMGLLIFPMNIEFLLGVIIAQTVHKFPKAWVFPLLITGILIFSAGAYYQNNELSFLSRKMSYGSERVVLFGFASFLIIAALVKWELSSTMKVQKIFLKLGDASYSIYLIHLPFVAAFCKLLVKFNVKNSIIIYLLSSVLIAGVCFLGIVIFNKIEKPLIKKFNKLLL